MHSDFKRTEKRCHRDCCHDLCLKPKTDLHSKMFTNVENSKTGMHNRLFCKCEGYMGGFSDLNTNFNRKTRLVLALNNSLE